MKNALILALAAAILRKSMSRKQKKELQNLLSANNEFTWE